MGRKRRRVEIVADVLRAAKCGARKTEIMYDARLSYTLLIRYLRQVRDQGLVRRDGDEVYVLTGRGGEFLKEFKDYYERRLEAEETVDKIRDAEDKLEDKFLNMEAELESEEKKE